MAGGKSENAYVDVPDSISLYFLELGVLGAYPKVVDVFTSEDGRRGIYPVYSSRTGGGLKFYQEDLLFKESRLTLQMTAGPRWRQKYKAAFQDIRISNSIYADIIASSQVFPDEFFYGLGNEAPKKDRTNYTHKQGMAELTLGLKITEKLKAQTQIGYEANKIEGGRNKKIPSTTDPGLYNEKTLPGLTEQIKLGRINLTLHYDGKNHPGRPTAGSELMFSGGVFTEFSNNSFGFWKASVEPK